MAMLQSTIEPLLATIGLAVIGTGVVVGGITWAFKMFGERWLAAYFEKHLASFRHEQSKELEQLKSRLKLGEEEFKNAINLRDDQLKSLRDAALSQLGTRTAALDKRRLEAAERLWGSVIDYWPFKNATKWTTPLKIDEMLKAPRCKIEKAKKSEISPRCYGKLGRWIKQSKLILPTRRGRSYRHWLGRSSPLIEAQ